MSRYKSEDGDGNNVLISGREEIETDCPPRLKRRLQEARDAPIGTGQYLDDFGTMADTEESDRLFEGNYTFPQDGDYATDLILKEVIPLWEKAVAQ